MKNKKNPAILLTLFACLLTPNAWAQPIDSIMEKIYAMDLDQLMNTTVTIATKSDKPVTETPGIVSVITADEIRNMGARELEDVLQIVPGFELVKNFNGYYGLGVRGVKDPRSTARLLILLDGIPFNHIFYGFSIKTGYDFNMDAIERIEIIRGPGSALYGRNAFEGVVNIISKKGKTHKTAFVKGSLATFNTRELTGYYGCARKKLNASVAFRRIDSDLTGGEYTSKYGEHTEWNIFHNNFTTNANIEYGKLSFSGTYFNLKDGGLLGSSFAGQKMSYYSVTYQNQFGPKGLSLMARLYGRNEYYIEDLEILPAGLDLPVATGDTTTYADLYPLGVYYSPRSNGYLYGLETEIKYKVTEKHDVLFGVQADLHGAKNAIIKANISDFVNLTIIPGIGRDNQEQYEAGWVKNNGHDYQNLALYAQDIWNPNPKLSITLGGRVDYDSEFGTVFNPRAGIVWEPMHKTHVKLLYGRAYRAPTASEQFKTLGFAIGNENLKPEVINTMELAIVKNNNKMQNSLSLYRNNVSDMIYARIITSVDTSNTYHNIGKNTSTGIEFENKTILAKNIYVYFNYSYTISENSTSVNDRDSSFTQQDVAPHKATVGVNIHFLKHFNFNTHTYYRGKMKKYQVAGSGGQLTEVQDPIGNYAITNAALQINNLVKNINISFSAYNLFNIKYYAQDNEHLRLPTQPGIQLWMSVSYKIR